MAVLGYLALVLIHLLLGYQVVKLSRKVQKAWPHYKCDFDTFLLVMLYPASAFNTLKGRATGPGLESLEEVYRYTRWYVILHLLFWEIRIAVNFLMWLFYTFVLWAVGLLILPLSAISDLYKGAFVETASTPKESEPQKVDP